MTQYWGSGYDIHVTSTPGKSYSREFDLQETKKKKIK